MFPAWPEVGVEDEVAAADLVAEDSHIAVPTGVVVFVGEAVDSRLTKFSSRHATIYLC